MDQIKIGQFIAQKRKACGFTQRQLADILNISDKTVSKWERGMSKPRIEKLPAIAKLYGCTVEDLLKDLGDSGGDDGTQET